MSERPTDLVWNQDRTRLITRYGVGSPKQGLKTEHKKNATREKHHVIPESRFYEDNRNAQRISLQDRNRSTVPNPNWGLLMPECFDRIHFGGPRSGIEPGQDSDENRNSERQENRPQGHDGFNLVAQL